MEKTEQPKGKAEESQSRCLSCGVTSASRPLVQLEFRGEERWVCVRCLPILIHGGG
ncbi:MAG: hypothetical protein HYX94_08760 [Chloroflexi bacterium]|nr:hypothetical protein [Chloroflexota bacterium]